MRSIIGWLRTFLVGVRDFVISSAVFLILSLRWTHFLVGRNLGRKETTVGLIVAMSSFRGRFKFLARSIKCALTQSRPPEKIVVYLSETDASAISSMGALRRLERFGVEYRTVRGQDWRSYKRLMAFNDFLDSTIVFVDDDLFLRRTLIGDLLNVAENSPNSIISHRANVITYQGGALAPYNDWPGVERFEVSNGDLVLSTGAGTLYPPSNQRQSLVTPEVFLELAPTADDLWLYFAQRNMDTPVICTGAKHRKLIVWFGSQAKALWRTNLAEKANDVQFQRLVARFGSHESSLRPQSEAPRPPFGGEGGLAD